MAEAIIVCREGHPLDAKAPRDHCGQLWCKPCQAYMTPRTEPATPLADEAERQAAAIKRRGGKLARIQEALEERTGPSNYAAVLEKIRHIIEEDDDGE